jgi:TolB-like protein
MTLLQRLRTLRFWPACALLGTALLLGACSSLDRGHAPALEPQAAWTVLPFANHTETPMAGSRAQAIAQSLLLARAGKVQPAPANTEQEALFDAADASRRQQALEWARSQKVRYALTGTVEEWRYKVGVDGEPAAGVTLQIIDVATGEILWSGSGGKSGWSREALSAVAHKLIRDLIDAGLAGTR